MKHRQHGLIFECVVFAAGVILTGALGFGAGVLLARIL